MPYHHLAVATRDIAAIDEFYAKAMGFELVKVVVGKTPAEMGKASEEGWAKHFFYDTGGGQLMAFWEIHDETIGDEFPTGLARAAGLPDWVNHVAFGAEDLNDLAKKKQRLLDHGHDVVEIDHRWCHSIYAVDPNGTLVEFCTTTVEFSEADRELARRALREDDIEFEEPKRVQVHRAP